MFKQILHKVLSINLACLLFITTASFAIQKHYCHDNLMDVSVFAFQEDEGCVDELRLESCHNTTETVKCCIDKVDVYNGQDMIQDHLDYDLSKVQKIFFTAFVYVHLNLFEDVTDKQITEVLYTPPSFNVDRQVLHQVFLI